MKRILLIFFLSVSCSVFCQDSTGSVVAYQNELSLDVTGTIRQFLYFNGSQFPEYYTPIYNVAYRRNTNCGNLRFGIGGYIENRQIAPYDTADHREFFNKSYQVDLRAGWEFENNIGKRWQFFYGLDYRQTFSHQKNDAPYSNAGYYNGSESTIYSFGMAPVAGFRFRINDRVSLYTESSFSILYEITDTRRYYIPVTSAFPPKGETVAPTLRSLYGRFSQPLSIFLAFSI